MAIFDLDYTLFVKNMLPPRKRMERFISYLTVLTYPLQWLRDIIFDDYYQGINYNAYSALDTYNIGDRLKWEENGLYICIQPTTAGIPPSNTDYFYKISHEYVGINTRVNYTGQKKVLEYALNKHFNTTFNQPPTDSEIYLVTNITDVNYFVSGIGEDLSSCAALDSATATSAVGTSYTYNAYELSIYVPNTKLASIAGEIAPYTNAKEAVLSFANDLIIGGIQAEVIGY